MMLVRLEGESPLHLQIYHAFREAILSGRLSPGTRLPSSRAEARSIGVSRNVVLQAYAQLVAEGYLTGSVGSGTYVARELPEVMLRAPVRRNDSREEHPSRMRVSAYAMRAQATTLASRRPVRYDFAYGVSRPDDTTLRQWQRAIRRASERPRFDYAPPEGESSLREAIAAHLFKNRGVQCSASEVVLTSGSQQALSLISRMLFEPGEAIVVEEPTYQGARQIFESDGLRVLARTVDEDGLDIETSDSSGARGCYVTPSHQFPTGVTMPLARRLKVLAWAEAQDAVVIEDDYDSEYRYEGRPLEAIQRLDGSGRVIYVGTFSKVLFPAVRLGFVVLPKSLVSTFVKAKWLADRHSPRLEQRALADLIASGAFEQHLRRARARNASRRAALMDALADELGGAVELSGANAGIHLVAWMRSVTPDELDRLVEQGRTQGVGLYSVSPYYASPPSRAGLLFGYGSLEEGDIREGIRRFARLLRS